MDRSNAAASRTAASRRSAAQRALTPRTRRAARPPLPSLLLLLLALAPASSAERAGCGGLLAEYGAALAARTPEPFEPPGSPNTSLVFFLHVPRTAGRSFNACLLRLGTPPAARCPKAYDALRGAALARGGAAANCTLVSSHDDLSALWAPKDAPLPADRRVSVVTQLRDPFERFVSAYEFAVELAAGRVARQRHLARRRERRQRQRQEQGEQGKELEEQQQEEEQAQPQRPPPTWGVAVSDVWPWSRLIPFFADDMVRRLRALEAAAAARQAKGGDEDAGVWVARTNRRDETYYYNLARNESRWQLSGAERARLLPPLDPYDNELVMPLREFVAHPMAADLLHNGQALQVLGLTEYSRWRGAEGLRRCAAANATVARELTQAAEGLLHTFSHAGAIERLFESVEAAAAALRLPLDSDAHVAKERRAVLKGRDPATGKRIDPTLGAEYHRCAARHQRRSAARRLAALAALAHPFDGRRVAFGRAARRAIPWAVEDEIRRLSAMDEAVYVLGRRLLSASLARLAARPEGLPRLPDVRNIGWPRQPVAPAQQQTQQEQQQQKGSDSKGGKQHKQAQQPPSKQKQQRRQKKKRPAAAAAHGGVKDEL